MNDITALAQQLRATAEKANEHGEFNMAMHTVQVLALVEALEKAQRYIEELREWNAGLAQESFERQQYAKERDEENQSLMLTVGRLRVERESLESRTVTVKLPTGYAVRPGHPINEGERGVMIPKDGGVWLSRFDVEHMLKVAGIQVIEGEA